MEETITMSNRDLDRLMILKRVLSKELTQCAAARLLDISDRQVRKLITRLSSEGPKGIISRLIGKKGNRNKPFEVKQKIMGLLREKYEDFGPTFAAEKLLELDGLKISPETLRQWMMAANLWFPKSKKIKRHTPRARREFFGELIQADGSPHRWFGPEGPEVNATVLVDDATSTITALYFSETETLDAYMRAFEMHLQQYGRPRAFYTDKYTIFKSPVPGNKTQMQRMLRELDIELILANSPEAKGRVERTNRTLQDRLLKEMRLRGITTIEQANAFAREYVRKHNLHFSKKPVSDIDAHRSLEGYDLNLIFSRKEERSLNAVGIFQFNNIHYQIQGVSETVRLNRQKIELRICKSGEMKVYFREKEVKVLPLNKVMESPKEYDNKELMNWKGRCKKIKPSYRHPWRVAFRRAIAKKYGYDIMK
jgi:hypothetical protein